MFKNLLDCKYLWIQARNIQSVVLITYDHFVFTYLMQPRLFDYFQCICCSDLFKLIYNREGKLFSTVIWSIAYYLGTIHLWNTSLEKQQNYSSSSGTSWWKITQTLAVKTMQLSLFFCDFILRTNLTIIVPTWHPVTIFVFYFCSLNVKCSLNFVHFFFFGDLKIDRYKRHKVRKKFGN